MGDKFPDSEASNYPVSCTHQDNINGDSDQA